MTPYAQPQLKVKSYRSVEGMGTAMLVSVVRGYIHVGMLLPTDADEHPYLSICGMESSDKLHNPSSHSLLRFRENPSCEFLEKIFPVGAVVEAIESNANRPSFQNSPYSAFFRDLLKLTISEDGELLVLQNGHPPSVQNGGGETLRVFSAPTIEPGHFEGIISAVLPRGQREAAINALLENEALSLCFAHHESDLGMFIVRVRRNADSFSIIARAGRASGSGVSSATKPDISPPNLSLSAAANPPDDEQVD